MQLIKTLNFKSKYFGLALFIVFFALTRLPSLATDAINPDGINWHYRSEQFVVGLKSGQFEKTYQHYHPGVTLMWIAGSGIELVKQLFPAEAVYNHVNFFTYHFFAKFFVVVVQLVLSLVLLYGLNKVTKSFWKSLFVVALVSLEPFFLGNSRLLHMDVLLSLLLFSGLIFAYDFFKKAPTGKANILSCLLAAFLLAQAFLTKSIAIGALPFVLVIGGYMIYSQTNIKTALKWLGLFALTYIVTVFIFFPALWTQPVFTLTNIFSEGTRVGVRNGHEQIFLGEETTDAGPIFYFFVLLVKVSPFTLLGVFLYKVSFLRKDLFKKFKLSEMTFPFFLAVFYVGYFVVMAIPSKKIDRYMLPLFPFLALYAVYGYEILYGNFYARFKENPGRLYTLFIATLAGLFLVAPTVALFPYYFTYTSPLVISPQVANTLIAQKPFGVGIPELREKIFTNYTDEFGEFPTLGFIDTKPMRAIYMNSRLFDVRVNGTSDYDIIVLGVNEQMPENVLNGEHSFVLDDVVYINGLEYWRIYVKELD